MNWDAIGAIGEVLGSIAVFVTLGYLAVQVRHARAETGRSISQGRAEAMREFCLQCASNEHLASGSGKLARAFGDGNYLPYQAKLLDAGFTDEEVAAAVWTQQALWYIRAGAYRQELTPGERAEFERGIRNNYGRNPIGRLWYEDFKQNLNPDTVRYVDSLLAQME